MSIRASCARRRGFFPGRIAVGIDARDGWVAVEGWAKTSNISALGLGRRSEDAGVAAIVYTDISRDGALAGLNIASTVALARRLVDPGHRLWRPRLDRGRQAPDRARLRADRRRGRRPGALRRSTGATDRRPCAPTPKDCARASVSSMSIAQSAPSIPPPPPPPPTSRRRSARAGRKPSSGRRRPPRRSGRPTSSCLRSSGWRCSSPRSSIIGAFTPERSRSGRTASTTCWRSPSVSPPTPPSPTCRRRWRRSC